MATVTITLTDGAPVHAGMESGVLIEVKSDPTLPLDGNAIDVDNATAAQATAWLMIQAASDAMGTSDIFTRPEA